VQDQLLDPLAFSRATAVVTNMQAEWDQDAALTPLGQLPFFVDILKTSGLFDAFVSDCPLRYQSPNAPKRHDVLGTTMRQRGTHQGDR